MGGLVGGIEKGLKLSEEKLARQTAASQADSSTTGKKKNGKY